MSKEKLKQNGTPVGAGPVSARNKTQKGITLIALVITIIVMLILVGVSVTTALNGGLFSTAKKATDEYGNAQNIEQIKVAYMMAKGEAEIENKTNREMFEKIRNNLSLEGATYEIASQSMTITTKEGKTYTLLADGELIEGNFAYLDIADGLIELKSNGYIQGENELVEYTGDYIITGTSNENIVRIMDEGTYNITIKDLKIDVTSISNTCAFNANTGRKATGCYVTITLEGENKLYGGGYAAGLGFAKATPNVDGVINGSTLTIQGNGKLEAVGGRWSAGIGSGYNGFDSGAGDANNIIINSGYIETKGGLHGAGIGSSLNNKANNIIINGGEIHTSGDSYGSGIGAYEGASNIIINGGTIYANSTTGAAIGSKNLDKLEINGGQIIASKTYGASGSCYGCIGGNGTGDITINGGTVQCTATYSNIYGIYSGTGNIKINGGSTKIISKAGELTSSVPVKDSSNLYLTPVQLENVKQKTQITNLTTSDNIEYGIKDMYTMQDDEETVDINEEGMLYLYLPLGTRTITIQVGGNTYSGTVETKEETSVIVLNKQ